MSDWVSAYKTVGAVGFLLIFMVFSLFYIGRYFKQVFESTWKKTDELQSEIRKQDAEKEKFYKKQLEIQKSESEERLKIEKKESEKRIIEIREELNIERKKSEEKEKTFMQQLGKIANILDKIEINFNNKLDEVNRNLSDQIKNIEEKIN